MGSRRYFNFIILVYEIQSFINVLLSLDFLFSSFELYVLLNIKINYVLGAGPKVALGSATQQESISLGTQKHLVRTQFS